MNILIINTLYAPFKVGGAEVSVQLLAEDMARNSHKVSVITLKARDSNVPDIEIINGVAVHRLPLANIYWPYKYQKKTSSLSKLIWHLIDTHNFIMANRVRSLIELIKPDVVHTNNLAGFSPAVIPKIKKLKVRIVHTARDYYFLHPNCSLMRRGNNLTLNDYAVRFWVWVRGRYLSDIDCFVGISQFVVDIYVKAFPNLNDKSTVIYNMVKIPDPECITPVENRSAIGFMGRLSQEKGFDVFVKIAHECEHLISDVTFLAAGRGDESYINSVLKKYPKARIKLLGFCDPADFFNQVRLVILPTSWMEPFGRVAVEALAYNCSVLATKVGGVAEILEYTSTPELDLNSNIPRQIEVAYSARTSGLPKIFLSGRDRYLSLYLFGS